MAANTRFATALHILTFLSRCEGPAKSMRIARSVGTNPVVVRRIVSRLANAGLAETLRGATGGTRLVRAPAEMTLLEVYDAMRDGALLRVHPGNRHCPISRSLRSNLATIFDEAESSLETRLAGEPLAHLVEMP